MPKASPFLQAVVANPAWTSDLFVVDVGARGGMSKVWTVFGNRLRAVGFEPLVRDVESLNEQEARPGVRYEAAFVGCGEYDSLCPAEARDIPFNPFARSSSVRAASCAGGRSGGDGPGAGADAAYTDRTVTLDGYFTPYDRERVDFLKVDTDGSDFAVLLGARELLRAGVLGLKVEVQFQGAAHPYANTFANIDHYLRGHGLTLYDLQLFRYSRSALPRPFTSRLMASTVSGQVLSGHALYFRDLAHPGYERRHPFAITPERVLKLAALFDVFDLPDCAAELLLNRGADPALLDLLPASAGYTEGSCQALTDRFDRDPSQFVFVPADSAGRIKELKAKNRELKDRLARRSLEARAARGRS